MDPEPLDYTDNGDGTVTLNNSPAPEAISIARVPWQNMVNGVYSWAVVTEEQNPDPDGPVMVQLLALDAVNVSATFRWYNTGPGRSTFLETLTWSS